MPFPHGKFVQQAGRITPGHVAAWTTDGVLQDAGSAAPISAVELLALLNALIPTLPTSPTAGITTLWLNGPGDGTGILTWS